MANAYQNIKYKSGGIVLVVSKKQTFLHGALILVCANLIVKIIGAIFRIPIYNILGGEGYANYQDAYTLYAMFFAISTAGLPVAIQRMISVANANQNFEEEKKIFKLALILFVLVGTVGTGIMIFGAKAYSSFVVKNDNAYFGILVLAPTLFFVCITSAFRGYFQGHQNMIPTAVSEIIEALCKLLIGIGAAMYALDRYGTERLDIVAAYAIGGLTVGVALGTFYLFLRRLLLSRAEHNIKVSDKMNAFKKSARKNGEIMKEIITISLPIMFSSLIVSMAGAIDSSMMKWRLEGIGWTNEAANEAFGDYFGMAVPFFSLPNTLVVPLAVSIISVIAAAFAENNKKLIKSTVESTFRVALIITMPCAFGIACMSKPILNLIYSKYPEAVQTTAPLLSILAIAVVFVSMMTITNSMLQAQGQEKKTIISMACGMLVKIISSYILIGIPEINRYGTPISTCLCYFTIMALNFYFLVKYTGIVPPLRRTFIKPFMSSSIMAICTILVYILMNNILGGSRIAIIPAVATAVLIYIILTLLSKTLTREDVLLLPKGTKIYDAMKKKNLVD